jgi:L-aminoadipate-semialdehyde dehydrogenase
MLKACTQLASRPDINNTVNIVPVDHEARVVVASALHPQSQMSVAHYPRLTFNKFLASLSSYGYDKPVADYQKWTATVQSYVESTQKAGRDPLAV